MGKLVVYLLSLVLSLAGTYMTAAAVIFVLGGGIKHPAAGQAAVRHAAAIAHAFIVTAGPSFVDLLQAIGSMITGVMS